ncbi:hypothetical protein [Luteimonas mephitis]|uniref:DUF7507 domain-containing protein n=1 Tax=Luteimonas mephitis TaxID=83615 RepID=UPI003A904005
MTSDPSTTTTPTTARSRHWPGQDRRHAERRQRQCITDAGDTIAYSFAVTNDGNVPLNVVINDAKRRRPIACTPSTIAVGGSASCGR